ncbi:hypothetical protein AVEN_102126-1, partial [Araneus ventricosus]
FAPSRVAVTDISCGKIIPVINTFVNKAAYAALLAGTKRDIPSKFATS